MLPIRIGIALPYNLLPNIQAVAEQLNRAIELKGEGVDVIEVDGVGEKCTRAVPDFSVIHGTSISPMCRRIPVRFYRLIRVKQRMMVRLVSLRVHFMIIKIVYDLVRYVALQLASAHYTHSHPHQL